VSDVSAILVAKITLREFGGQGTKILACKSEGSVE
jgi:hypothetical protein